MELHLTRPAMEALFSPTPTPTTQSNITTTTMQRQPIGKEVAAKLVEVANNLSAKKRILLVVCNCLRLAVAYFVCHLITEIEKDVKMYCAEVHTCEGQPHLEIFIGWGGYIALCALVGVLVGFLPLQSLLDINAGLNTISLFFGFPILVYLSVTAGFYASRCSQMPGRDGNDNLNTCNEDPKHTPTYMPNILSMAIDIAISTICLRISYHASYRNESQSYSTGQQDNYSIPKTSDVPLPSYQNATSTLAYENVLGVIP